MSQPDDLFDSARKLLLGFLLVLAIAPAFWLLLTAFAESTSLVTTGTVSGKRELILMGRGDSWIRLFEVSYTYHPADAPYAQTASHNVALDFYDRVKVGTRVRVHYSPWLIVRLMEGTGSYIEGAPANTRLRYGPFTIRDFAEIGGFFLAALLGLIAYKTSTRFLGVVAALIAAAAFPMVLLVAAALLVLPGLFWAWRKHPDEGFGSLLLVFVIATCAIPYWRVPHPQPLPPGPQVNTTAIVRNMKVVTRIWTTGQPSTPSRSSSGQTISRPFYMLDLEFTPPGSSEPVHAVDKVDIISVPGLQQGETVPIVYSAADARAAQLVGATRTYDRSAFNEMMEITFGVAIIVAFVAIPVLRGLDDFFGRYRRIFEQFASLTPTDIQQRLSRSPIDPIVLERIQQKMRKAQGAREGRSIDAPGGKNP